jgi:hypothetical protein
MSEAQPTPSDRWIDGSAVDFCGCCEEVASDRSSIVEAEYGVRLCWSCAAGLVTTATLPGHEVASPPERIPAAPCVQERLVNPMKTEREDEREPSPSGWRVTGDPVREYVNRAMKVY